VASEDEASACSELRLGCHLESHVIEPCHQVGERTRFSAGRGQWRGAWGERMVASGQWIGRREPAAMEKRWIEVDRMRRATEQDSRLSDHRDKGRAFSSAG